ncbi:hypothetical protein ACFQU7_21545 [Pseudoroseomonas wenyumeiae]
MRSPRLVRRGGSTLAEIRRGILASLPIALSMVPAGLLRLALG